MAVTLDRQADIRALQQRVRFAPDASVSAFLRRHPDLVPLLQEAVKNLPRYFPKDTTLRLHVLDDPDDSENDEPHLYAVIESGLPMAEARSRMYAFDDEWWLQAFKKDIAFVSLVVE